jgi:hypothetical protein
MRLVNTVLNTFAGGEEGAGLFINGLAMYSIRLIT